MSTKLPKTAPSLKQFLIRQEVLKLYREILRTIKSVPDASTRTDLKEWARSDFKSKKSETDVAAIKSYLHYGRKQLVDLQKSLSISK